MDETFILGIDIGGTTISTALVAKNAEIVNRHNLRTNEFENFLQLSEKLFEIYGNKLENRQIEAIGVGAPNGNFYTGSIDFAPNLSWGEHIEVVEILRSKFNLPVVITNDANAAACGEKYFGGATQMNDFAMVTLGTGLGSGIYVNGTLLQGKFGFGGELGHIIVEENGRKCGCGRNGCLETYVSVTGIRRTYSEIVKSDKYKSDIALSSDPTGYEIFQAALQNDEAALQAYKITADYLGKALANYITIFDPEAIFFMGGLSASKELIFSPTREVMEDNLMQIFRNKVKLLNSELPDADAAILGAAAIARESLKM